MFLITASGLSIPVLKKKVTDSGAGGGHKLHHSVMPFATQCMK